MSPTEITTIAGVIIAMIGSVAIPLWLNKLKERRLDDHVEALDSRSVAQMFKAEKESLQTRLDKVIADYEQKIATLRADYERKLAESDAAHQAQIAGLRAEIDALYRRLYSQQVLPPPPAAT